MYKNSTLTKDPPRVRKYAFVTDTLKCSNIVEIIKDVDILYHEATYLHKDLDLARLSCHSTALQAAQIAHDSGAKNYYWVTTLVDTQIPKLLKRKLKQFLKTRLLLPMEMFIF